MTKTFHPFAIFIYLLKYLQCINAVCDLMFSGIFLAITDGRHTSNDTANFDIQSASHETTKPLWPCTRSTGVYIQLLVLGMNYTRQVFSEVYLIC